ncbi:sodium:solute symporter family protein [Virgibacillus sp. NKC19-3]|uniref:sodium:solute symporter family protein n=1 Tax=Virgibacillus saliphilus TaxID=2831674 RepID=UPI001C9AC655|nr:sodium:solute symporter family protein [Virgibacillus sp. NKC19-3]MBY7144430.1 sodium:solute symporter family protein [Virgibacillus sp. NKC19-3]
MAYLIGILIAFLVFILIGIILARKVTNVDDYYVSGRNAPTLLITGSLVASFLSSVTFMGEAGFSYEGYPIVQLTLVVFNASGYVIGAFFFGRYLRRSQALTVPEYFGKRFDSQKIRKAAAITTILGVSAYIVAVTQGGALLFSSVSGLSYGVSLIIIWVAYTSFTFLSGAKGVLVNDTIMFIIFLLATVIGVPFIINATGGWPNAIMETASLQSHEGILSWHGMVGAGANFNTPAEALAWAIILGGVWGVVVAVSPWQTSRYLMAKSEHVVIRSGVIATISIFVIYLFLHIGMATVNVVNPNISPTENAFIWSAINLMPTWLGVIVLVGIMAAILSSCSTFLQLIGNSVAHDIFIYKEKNSKKVLKFSRNTMLVSSSVIFFITLWQPPAVMWIGYFAATLFAASWGPIAFSSIYSKSVTKNAAFWSIILGFLGVVGAELFQTLVAELPIYLHPVIIGVLLSTGSLIFISRTENVTEVEKEFRQKILQIPDTFGDANEITITKRYPNVLIISGVLLIAITFVFYFTPLYLL